jgi:stage II sporulation protein D
MNRTWMALGVLALMICGSCAPLPPPTSTAQPATPGSPPVARGGASPGPPAAAFDLREEPVIDVGLAWDLDSLVLDPTGTGGTSLQRPGRAPEPLNLSDQGEIRFWRQPGGFFFKFRGGEGASALESGDTLWMTEAPDRTRDRARMRWRGRTWRGTFKIFVNPRGALTLVDRLPLETYLLGVVPGEIGALDEKLIEAGKAQAVAARSYTLFYRGRRAAEGFDLFGTVEDQVYGPVESERPLATRCVQATRGSIALSRGFPIRANYSSTCGGITAEVWEAWPAEALPYLSSHADRGTEDWCAASPQYRWREEWSAAELVANLRRFGPAQGVALPAGDLGDLLDVRVDARSRSGRVWRLVIVTRGTEVSLPAYSIRQVLRRGGNPGAILRSNLFKIDVRRDPTTHRALAVVASGAGSGHGVGLCQTGALGMARAGMSAESILHHYYPGASLEHRY